MGLKKNKNSLDEGSINKPFLYTKFKKVFKVTEIPKDLSL